MHEIDLVLDEVSQAHVGIADAELLFEVIATNFEWDCFFRRTIETDLTALRRAPRV